MTAAVLSAGTSPPLAGPEGFGWPTAVEASTPLLELDLGTHEVLVLGYAVTLTAKEFALLSTLARAPAIVFTKRDLLREVWGVAEARKSAGRAVDAQACRLRAKLGQGSRLVHAIRGVGYRLVAPSDVERVCVGERRATVPSLGAGPRPLGPVAGVGADQPFTRVYLTAGPGEALLVMGHRVTVAEHIVCAAAEGKALVELRGADGVAVSVNPAHVTCAVAG